MTNISINEKDYVVESLPEELQNLIKIYQIWDEDLSKARLEVLKTEAALRQINSEITLKMNKLEEHIQKADLN